MLAIVICLVVGVIVVAVFSTDAGSDLLLGCGALFWLVCLGALTLFLIAVFGFGCAVLLA